jgi:linoleoyl-CoA desaturase
MTKTRIKFPAQDKADFINELRDRVKDYFESNKISKYGNANLVLKTIFMLTLMLTPFILMMTGVVTSLVGILMCWVIMGAGVAGVGMTLMHDANHGTYSKNRKVNTFLGYSLYLLGGFPANWQQQHNIQHHSYTNIEGHDEDISPMGALRFSPHSPRYKIHRFQHLYAWFLYGLMTFSWVTFKDFKQLTRYKRTGVVLSRNESYTRLYIKLVTSKILYYSLFLVLPIILLPVAWYWVVLGLLASLFTSGIILSTIFQTAHVVPSSEYPKPDENGNMDNNWAIHQLITTADFSPRSRFFSWMIGGLNYQVEHHLFPNISHVHYKKISPLVQNLAVKYGLPYHVQPDFITALSSHARMLKMLGRS